MSADRKQQKKELEKSIITDKEQLSSIEQFAEQISGYAGIMELNFKIINQLIEKILVSEPVEIVPIFRVSPSKKP